MPIRRRDLEFDDLLALQHAKRDRGPRRSDGENAAVEPLEGADRLAADAEHDVARPQADSPRRAVGGDPGDEDPATMLLGGEPEPRLGRGLRTAMADQILEDRLQAV